MPIHLPQRLLRSVREFFVVIVIQGEDAEMDDAGGDDFPAEESPDSEGDEAIDDEIHDLALAVETSGFSQQGHEVTSRPSEDDQGESIRIATEAIEPDSRTKMKTRSPL